MKRRLLAGAAALVAVGATGWGATTSWAETEPAGTTPEAFEAAAAEFGVPAELLKAYSYALTGWRDHGGRPSADGGYGLMHLTSPDTMDEAGRLGAKPDGLTGWYPVVARLTSGKTSGPVARDVFATLRRGAGDGQLRIAADPAAVAPPQTRSTGEAECPAELDCQWLPAAYASNDDTDVNAYGNYDTANRPADVPIKYIVVHDTEGSYTSTLNTFQNPLSYTSSHYVIRSADGEVTQMVRAKDIAWHAGNSLVNTESIGIEHEGFAAEGATWFTDAMYRNSAALVRFLAAKYRIPLDRQHILGHDDVANQRNFAGSHTDPGPFWDWDRYMELLKAPAPRPGDDLVTIAPDFATNQPQLTTCADTCQDLPQQPAGTVLLRTEPRDDAPLLTDPVLGGGTTDVADMSDKVTTGRTYAVAARQGAWTAIWYGGQQAWLPSAVLHPAAGKVLRPRDGVEVKVYPANLPEPAEWPEGTPAGNPATPPAPAAVYTISGDQRYQLADRSRAMTYYARFGGYEIPANHTVIRGAATYYRISFNHRHMYVNAADVELC
ncbi:N-acetylmuramoyl-L-alanine amidase [Symbioplanes lichenis]|uniref:N-acetylmuramoyl-L-alanine amidase n=1 Tax=Symbioplanes lichenis TaxID=1629072 RepID=UPI002738823B|nr:peptidoglycan recognition family protein [Actinoplanes lichenis]